MGKGKPRHKPKTRAAYIFCRSVGPGGTDVTMTRVGDRIRCVWQNEECPYTEDKDDDGAATDGHNVSWITVKDIKEMLGE